MTLMFFFTPHLPPRAGGWEPRLIAAPKAKKRRRVYEITETKEAVEIPILDPTPEPPPKTDFLTRFREKRRKILNFILRFLLNEGEL